MDIYLYVFLTNKIELSTSSSTFVQSLVYAEDSIDIDGYHVMASSPSAIHGLLAWDAFKTVPDAKEAVLAKAESLWENRDAEERKKLIQNDLLEHEQECDLYKNEPIRWKSFIEDVLTKGKTEKVGLLLSDNFLGLENLEIKNTSMLDVNEAFFRNIKKNIFYNFLIKEDA
jgi:hypothetical protein